MWSVASATTSAGGEAVGLAELARLDLMPWQRLVVDGALGQCVWGPGPDDWRWAAFEVLLLVSRQNGKGTCLEAIELYALFSLGLNVFHTAHLMKTSRKAAARLWALIERTPQLRRRVLRRQVTAEEIVITLTNGAFIVFMARSGRAGRGLDDCDVLVLDESLFLDAKMTEATIPTMSTRPHPLVIYAGSAEVETSTLQRGLRARLHEGDPALTGFDWSIDREVIDAEGFDPVAVEVVAQANPSLGALITMDYVRGEYRAMSTVSPRGYYRERLGVPDLDPSAAAAVIPAAKWSARAGAVGRPVGPVAFGGAAAWPDAESASIAVAGRDADGQLVVQVVEHGPGTAWLRPRLRELAETHDAVAVIDEAGPAGFLVDGLEEDGVDVVRPTPREVAHAAKRLLKAIVGDVSGEAETLWHYGQPELDAAVRAAGRRPLGDAWTWQRRSEADISPLEAVTLAVWGLEEAVGVPLAAWSS